MQRNWPTLGRICTSSGGRGGRFLCTICWIVMLRCIIDTIWIGQRFAAFTKCREATGVSHQMVTWGKSWRDGGLLKSWINTEFADFAIICVLNSEYEFLMHGCLSLSFSHSLFLSLCGKQHWTYCIWSHICNYRKATSEGCSFPLSVILFLHKLLFNFISDA